ncbi:hypothetical protein Poli38472_004155 [Pythium oligandrum]|uniref:Exonuclease 1 n=1 Tax=Pythium oligandrum TaxID=41045 RepID=A0A8K1FJT1_PYTOL|nr:hypothetical protein Poli38472_004155 [Pythium oligandrum]|eukprot:TMW66390.1 hypothetical protein Poli38472_004155 [Pythium oligandrum]
MGISGLLPVLKSITVTKDLREYRGETLAIDGYCWLHRAIYSCSQELCLGQDTDKYGALYIVYFTDRVNALLQNGVTPYVVFDGGPLPMKKGTEEERRASRAKNRELGLKYYQQRNYAEARKCFVRAADVTPYMAHRVIQRLKAMNVQYVVAPYEADAQLTYLMKNGLADGVITEDSDCLPFGCSKVLFKMDRDGVAQEVRTDNLGKNKGMSFHMFSDDMFLEMCIFSGCDYLPSLPGIGLKKAYSLLKQHGSVSKMIRAVRLEGKTRVTSTYEAEFERAFLTFRHQRVYDPRTKKIVPLTPIPSELLEKDAAMEFLGPDLSDDIAQAIAEGDMDPITKDRFAPASTPSGTINSYPPAVHSQEAATYATSKSVAEVPAQRPTVRNLPSWASKKTPSPLKQQWQPPQRQAVKPVTPTSRTISHFFASKEKKMSPVDESHKSTQNEPSDCSSDLTYQSQDQTEVDVTRSISFSPMDEEVKAVPHVPVHTDKENQTPESVASAPTSISKPPGTENAFARMMRAGSAPSKNPLKRKATSFSSRVGRFQGGGVMRHHESALERIKKHAFGPVETRPLSQISKEPAIESDLDEPEDEPNTESNQSRDSASQCIVRSACLQERLVVKEERKALTTATSRPPTKDAFAQFRFVKK